MGSKRSRSHRRTAKQRLKYRKFKKLKGRGKVIGATKPKHSTPNPTKRGRRPRNRSY